MVPYHRSQAHSKGAAMEHPIDTITVRASASEEVYADRADLLVSVRGSSLVTGGAALTKAQEVRQLVQDLARVGLPEQAVTLRSVTAETSSSVIGKSSSANYQLRVRTPLDNLANVLGAITAQKNAQIIATTWLYADLDAVQDGLLRQGLARARAKAELIAQSLGSALDRVHTATESLLDHEEGRPFYPQAAMAKAPRTRSLTSEDLGMDVTHAKRITAEVEVVYRIRPA
ncbi:SIMPL domain-containing protein [Chloroflexia bacterium SDU3-3]|nr:SIMPL domain-containing protein [Chloroflexia bacterium SDU3-3]